VVQDLKAMGAPDDVIAQFEAEQVDNKNCDVMSDNWDAVNLFLQASTQWRYIMVQTKAGMITQRSGLDYTAIHALMQMNQMKDQVRDQAEVLGRIRVIEQAALEAMQ